MLLLTTAKTLDAARALSIGKDGYHLRTHRFGFPVEHATNPLCRFAAKGCFATACTNAGWNVLHQYALSFDHENFAHTFLVSFCRTTHMALKHSQSMSPLPGVRLDVGASSTGDLTEIESRLQTGLNLGHQIGRERAYWIV